MVSKRASFRLYAAGSSWSADAAAAAGLVTALESEALNLPAGGAEGAAAEEDEDEDPAAVLEAVLAVAASLEEATPDDPDESSAWPTGGA